MAPCHLTLDTDKDSERSTWIFRENRERRAKDKKTIENQLLLTAIQAKRVRRWCASGLLNGLIGRPMKRGRGIGRHQGRSAHGSSSSRGRQGIVYSARGGCIGIRIRCGRRIGIRIGIDIGTGIGIGGYMAGSSRATCKVHAA